MSVFPYKNDSIKFIPSKTDFIDKTHMIITSYENSTQQIDYIMKKFKFFRSEKENLKLLQTHTNSTQFFKSSKGTINDWKNQKLSSKTALNTFHNNTAKPPTTFRNTYSSNNFLARYKVSADDDYNARATYDNFFDENGKDKQIKNRVTTKCSFSQPLPLLFKENDKISINMNFAKTMSANNTMFKFYKVKKKKHSITQLELQSIASTSKINFPKEFITEESLQSKKIYLKNIEFSLIKKNQPMDVIYNGDNKNASNNPSKRLYLDYLNNNNKDFKNPYEHGRKFHVKN